jgi:leucyl aminopeptidase
VQLRVVSDQPWDVKVDVLVVPILGKPDFAGPLAELDKRSGGELSSLASFGELPTKRFKTALAGAGEAAASRILLVGAGDPATLDRETVVKLAATAERRLAARTVASMGIWISPLAAVLDGGAELVAQLIARGVVEGHYDPSSIYREGYAEGPPKLDGLTLIAPDTETAPLVKAAEKGVIIGEGANIARTLANRSSNDVSPEVLAEEAWTLAEK